MKKNKLLIGAALAASLLTLSFGIQSCSPGGDATAQAPQAPSFEVDPFWPKPLGNEWILGNVIIFLLSTVRVEKEYSVQGLRLDSKQEYQFAVHLRHQLLNLILMEM